MKRPFLLIGLCLRPHGIRGELLVKSLTDDDGRFFQGLTCHLLKGPEEWPGQRLTLEGARPVPKGLLLSFRGIGDRDKARALAGSYLAVRREDALALENEFEFYTGDLIGMEVKDPVLGLLGRVADVMDTGTGNILLVEKEGEKEVLIPFLKDLILSLDLDENLITVSLPEGLLELYRPGPQEGS